MSNTLCYPPRLSNRVLSHLGETAANLEIRSAAGVFCRWICTWVGQEQVRRRTNELIEDGVADEGVAFMEPGFPELPAMNNKQLIAAVACTRSWQNELNFVEEDLLLLFARIESTLINDCLSRLERTADDED